MLRRLVEGGRTEAGAGRSSGTTAGAREHGDLKLEKLSESDDIEAYLVTFEQQVRAYETRWAFKLTTQLTGKAQQAYGALPAESTSSYQELKAAILRWCRNLELNTIYSATE